LKQGGQMTPCHGKATKNTGTNDDITDDDKHVAPLNRIIVHPAMLKRIVQFEFDEQDGFRLFI